MAGNLAGKCVAENTIGAVTAPIADGLVTEMSLYEL
jgi:hypothetical protein